MINIFKIMGKIFQKVKELVELGKYNSFTIADYFRKQGAQIGEGCSIITKSLGTEPYLIKIGNHVTIASGVGFGTHDGGTWIFRNEIPNLQVFGPIVIEDNCVIGQNAIIFGGVRIGKNSIIGAGSVVISDIPPNTIAMGVPARPFGAVKKYGEKCIEKWKIQQPPDCIIEEGKDWWRSKNFKENREKLRKHLVRIFSKELGMENNDE